MAATGSMPVTDSENGFEQIPATMESLTLNFNTVTLDVEPRPVSDSLSTSSVDASGSSSTSTIESAQPMFGGKQPATSASMPVFSSAYHEISQLGIDAPTRLLPMPGFPAEVPALGAFTFDVPRFRTSSLGGEASGTPVQEKTNEAIKTSDPTTTVAIGAASATFGGVGSLSSMPAPASTPLFGGGDFGAFGLSTTSERSAFTFSSQPFATSAALSGPTPAFQGTSSGARPSAPMFNASWPADFGNASSTMPARPARLVGAPGRTKLGTEKSRKPMAAETSGVAGIPTASSREAPFWHLEAHHEIPAGRRILAAKSILSTSNAAFAHDDLNFRASMPLQTSSSTAPARATALEPYTSAPARDVSQEEPVGTAATHSSPSAPPPTYAVSQRRQRYGPTTRKPLCDHCKRTRLPRNVNTIVAVDPLANKSRHDDYSLVETTKSGLEVVWTYPIAMRHGH
ncbi:hypothetical protein HDV00_002565 [Rhizophlyctis rosea]|nr:hypothetical protein HDV00_002565 [Rhizophlyctis rosea]